MSKPGTLVERVEAATGPDRELDARIHYHVMGLDKVYSLDTFLASDISASHPKHYTSSLDAAMTLVPSGWSFSVGQNVHHKYWHGLVQRVANDGEIESFAETSNHGAALALTSAALKARASNPPGNDGDGK